MGKMRLGAAVLMTMAVMFGPPGVVMADHLPAPTDLVHFLVDRDGHGTNDAIAVEWDAVKGATKYSVHVIAGYDTDGDGVVDAAIAFDFSTLDRTDGAPMNAPFLDIPHSHLARDVTDDGIDNPVVPIDVQVRVEALDSPVEILVKFRPDAPASEIARLHAAHNATVAGVISGIEVTRVQVPPDQVDASIEDYRRSPAVEFAEPNYEAQALDLFPNDPLFANQWGLTKIEAPQAWPLVTGGNPATIAIIDTGVDAGHPDLAGKVLAGYNFVKDNGQAGDDNGHGTRVAGIAAAVSDNGQGVASVAWQSKILPVKVLDRNGVGTYADVASGITWAADQGARVLNLSLGGGSYSDTLKAAVDYAWAKDTVIVAAAGNNGSYILYPAAFANVVAVGATDELDNKAGFSSIGPELDVVAPGVNILSTARKSDGTYASGSGTSFASPFVAGAAALLWTQGLSTNTEVVTRILSTTDNLGVCGWDSQTGWGRVDLYNILTNTLTPRPRKC
jgi:thermitase